MIVQDDTPRAIQQIEAIQRFKKKYWITDTVEQGIQAIQDFMDLLPGQLLCVDYHHRVSEEEEEQQQQQQLDQLMPDPQHHRQGGASRGGSRSSSSAAAAASGTGMMLAMDCSKNFPATVMASEQNQRIHMVGCYYLLKICCSQNLDAARGGLQILLETSGCSSHNFDLSLGRQQMDQLWWNFPIHFQEIRLYNTNPVVDGFFDLIRPLMPRKMREAVKVGCQIDFVGSVVDEMASSRTNTRLNSFLSRCPFPTGITLPSLIFQPNYDTAMQHNLIPKIRNLLQERYQNERSFRLCIGSSSSSSGDDASVNTDLESTTSSSDMDGGDGDY